MLVQVSIGPAGIVKIVRDTGLEIGRFTKIREAAEYLKTNGYEWVFGSNGFWLSERAKT